MPKAKIQKTAAKNRLKQRKERVRRVVMAGMIGNGLEWYDYALYGHFAAIISIHFFPVDNPDNQYLSLIATFGVFAAGFIMRPLGAVLFGYIGDTYGRRSSLAISILMMAIPTAMIGLLPTYAQIGVWAPVLLTCFRLLQGLALGGEFSGSITYVVEHSPMRSRGQVGGTSLISALIGILLGAFVATAFSRGLPPEDFQQWGWRVPFIIGLLIGVVGFYIRNALHESPAFVEAKAKSHISKTPVRETFRTYPGRVVMGMGIFIGVTVPFYFYTVFMTSYMQRILGYPVADALWVTTVGMLLVTALIPFAAKWSDAIGRKPLLIAGALGYILLAYPIFLLIDSGDMPMVMLGMAVFGMVMALYIAGVPALMVEIFPTRVRYTGMALACNLSAALFGGTTPMLVTWLVQVTGNHNIVWLVLAVTGLIALSSVFFYRETYRIPLQPARD